MEPQAWESQMAVLTRQFEKDNALGTVGLVCGGVEMTAAVAETAEQRAMGMIGKTFDEFQAMLFKQDGVFRNSFHNNGVGTDLLVALFDDNGVLVEQFRLAANDPTVVTPTHAFQYAIELPGSTADLAEGATFATFDPTVS